MIPRKILTVIRSSGSRVNGRASSTSTTTYQITASVHPVTEKQLLDLGGLTKDDGEVYKLITNNVLRPISDSTFDADIVQIDGKYCRVIREKEWKNQILEHNVYFAQEIINYVQ